MPTDDVTLPPEDRCAAGVTGAEQFRCGKSRAEHDRRYIDGGPGHEFIAPEGEPRPEHITGCHIQTDWTCTHCGADNDVWGEVHEWMECSHCGGQSFLVPFLTEITNRENGSRDA